MFDSFDHQCMSQALQLAELGLNTTDPNPRVGCVLARNGEVIATGWHRRSGEAHAEIIALERAGAAARGTTAYVTLEPCSHHGRTPACAPALIKAGVVRVVSALRDDNPKVNGSGLCELEAAGIQIESGLLCSGSTYSTTSRSKPDKPVNFSGAPSTFILRIPRSEMICAPIP